MFNSLSAEGINPKNEEAAYKISVHFIPYNLPIPQSIFLPGNQGNIEAFKVQQETFDIKWEGFEIDTSTQISIGKPSNIKVLSKIYLSPNLIALNMGGRCELLTAGPEFQFVLENGNGMKYVCFSNYS
jgi:hypothetical protein